MQLLVYTQKITPRIEYIFSTLFKAIGVQKFQLTHDFVFYNKSQDFKLNYSSSFSTEDILWIEPVNLLFENDVKEQKITVFTWNKTKAFFRTNNGDLPFDIFAASFYLITRYEEYLPHQTDVYGRYAHENSLAYKEDFLKVPLVNIWLQQLQNKLLQKFPSLQLFPADFRFLPTYDIDIAWSYLYKGWLRNLGGLLVSVTESEWARANERINVLFGKQKDPFDSYEWLDQLHEKNHLEPIYFFLLARQNKDYDKNILPSKPVMQRLVQKHSSTYTVGIHPSWQSGNNTDLLEEEIQIFEKITGGKVNKSRQHYIRMHLPDTYKRLIEAGIAEDYSMGYGSINGFRASWCLPYLWYDLQKEQTTKLTIYPFCFMDANSYYEQHATSEEALHEMNDYYHITKNVKGLFITIWHNHFLGTDTMFNGWKDAYQTAISRISTSCKK